MVTVLSVEVHCLQPRWVEQENSKYRLYIDDELLTERNWIWNQSTYIVEHMVVDLEQNSSHTIKVEVIKTNPSYLTQLGLNNLIVNEHAQDCLDGTSNSLSFVVA